MAQVVELLPRKYCQTLVLPKQNRTNKHEKVKTQEEIEIMNNSVSVKDIAPVISVKNLLDFCDIRINLKSKLIKLSQQRSIASQTFL
jgi:hypothetical protein